MPTVDSVDDAITTLSRITRIFPLSGSGEDVLPGESVEVKVLVASECGPVDGATVDFKNGERGSGTIDQVEATTANGIASCRWTPDPETPTQDLSATLTDVPGPGVLHVPDVTHFVANLNLASDTAYSPPESARRWTASRRCRRPSTGSCACCRASTTCPGTASRLLSDAKVELRAGVANRCGVGEPEVRLEQLRREDWEEVETVAPDGEGIASFSYEVADDPRQFLRAVLVSSRKPVGLPVYFTVSPAESGGPAPGSLTFNLERVRLSHVEDSAGRYQYEGGRAIDPTGQHTGNYSSIKRMTNDATPGQNVGTLTMTIFVLGATPPENLTLQGVHEFGNGGQLGSVSAASARYARFIGQAFEVRGDRLTIGEPSHPV